jgi:hypothetical protein
MWYDDPTTDGQIATPDGPAGPARRPASADAPPLPHQPQGLHPAPLAAALAPEAFLRTDYRGVTAFLNDLPGLRRGLGLRKVPPPSTRRYAEPRPLQRGGSAAPGGRPTAAVDGTGFEGRHAPRRPARRANSRRYPRRRYVRLTAPCRTASHPRARAGARPGPADGSPRPTGVMGRAAARARRPRVPAGAACDAGRHHRRGRGGGRPRSTAVPVDRRGRRQRPGPGHRRQVRQRSPERAPAGGGRLQPAQAAGGRRPAAPAAGGPPARMLPPGADPSPHDPGRR